MRIYLKIQNKQKENHFIVSYDDFRSFSWNDSAVHSTEPPFSNEKVNIHNTSQSPYTLSTDTDSHLVIWIRHFTAAAAVIQNSERGATIIQMAVIPVSRPGNVSFPMTKNRIVLNSLHSSPSEQTNMLTTSHDQYTDLEFES